MTMGLIVFACVFGGTLLGLYLSKKVAAHHLSADSKDAMKLALGVIGTLAALVLGLLLASAKSSFDAKGSGQLGIEYSVVGQDTFGQVAQIKLNVIPVIKSLIKDPIFGAK